MHIRERSRISVRQTTKESVKEQQGNVELSELRRDYEEEESGLTDVKASGGQDTRNSRKDSRLVLNETVQDVSDKGKQDRLDELKSALQGDYFK
jgi:hypothetical protein